MANNGSNNGANNGGNNGTNNGAGNNNAGGDFSTSYGSLGAFVINYRPATRSRSSTGSLHTFIGCDNHREKKVLAHAVSVMTTTQVDVPRFLNWSEQSITWSHANHVPLIEYPERVVLVVKPKIADYWLAKTLMDGGRTINIM